MIAILRGPPCISTPLSSAIAHALDVLRIASALDSDLRSCSFDLAKIADCEFYCDCADVFFEAIQLGRAGNRNDPWLLCQQPGERELRRRCFLAPCDLVKQVHHSLICFTVVGVEAW